MIIIIITLAINSTVGKQEAGGERSGRAGAARVSLYKLQRGLQQVNLLQILIKIQSSSFDDYNFAF